MKHKHYENVQLNARYLHSHKTHLSSKVARQVSSKAGAYLSSKVVDMVTGRTEAEVKSGRDLRYMNKILHKVQAGAVQSGRTQMMQLGSTQLC